jgi:S1-C subfamily serine protease
MAAVGVAPSPPAPATPHHESPSVDPSADKSKPPGPRRWLRLVLILVLIAVGTALVLWATTRDDAVTPTDIDQAIDDAFSSTTAAAPVGPAVYNAVIPSVVFIQVGEAAEEGSSIGSGVIINANGNIMTSEHVIDGASEISVTFADGTQSPAQVVQSDLTIDIAVLQTQRLPEVVVPAILGGGVQIGDEVFAIGNPLGLGGSFSAGVVSGLDRSLPLPDGRSLEQLIQFDAAVNPGSSGGPLLDRDGQVVGIVTALANPTGEDFFSGIAFAVPIATAGGAAGGPEQ